VRIDAGKRSKLSTQEGVPSQAAYSEGDIRNLVTLQSGENKRKSAVEGTNITKTKRNVMRARAIRLFIVEYMLFEQSNSFI
jgi:hypothetical protein